MTKQVTDPQDACAGDVITILNTTPVNSRKSPEIMRPVILPMSSPFQRSSHGRTAAPSQKQLITAMGCIYLSILHGCDPPRSQSHRKNGYLPPVYARVQRTWLEAIGYSP